MEYRGNIEFPQRTCSRQLTYSTGINSDGEVIAIKYDISGNSVWTLTIGQPGDDYSYGTGIAFEPSSGDAFMVGLIGAFSNPINFGTCNSLTINTNALDMFIKQICDADLSTASFKVGNNSNSNNDSGSIADFKKELFSEKGNIGKFLFYSIEGDKNATSITKDETIISINPNPASGLISLNIQMGKTQNASIGIYDIYGNLVQTVWKGKVYNNNFEINMINNSSGVYFVRVETEENTINKKITLIK